MEREAPHRGKHNGRITDGAIRKGTYDPIPKVARPGDPNGRPYKDIKLDRSRAQYWLGVGAQPSDTCWRLLSMAGLLEPKYRVGQVQEQVAKADAQHKNNPYKEPTPVESS